MNLVSGSSNPALRTGTGCSNNRPPQLELDKLLTLLSRLNGFNSEATLNSTKDKLSRRISYLIEVEMEQLNPSGTYESNHRQPAETQTGIVPGKLIR